MNINIEKDSLVVLIGAMGTGKSTFVKRYFLPRDVVATDKIREELTGDFQDQSTNEAVFDILNATILARAKLGILTVIDSTGTNSVINHAQKTAKEFDRPLYAFVFPELSEEELTAERMQHRMKVIHVYHNQVARINRTVLPKDMKVIHIPKEDRYSINLKISSSDAMGDYDLDPNYDYIVIPDLHGDVEAVKSAAAQLIGPNGRHMRAISLGDIVDRGPSSYQTFTMVNNLRLAGQLFHTTSNHDNKFYRWVKKFLANEEHPDGSVDVVTFGMKLANGLQNTVAEFYSLNKEERLQYARDFKEYYEAAKPMLRIVRGKEVNIFVHAGVTTEAFSGRALSQFDKSSFIYADQPMVEDIEKMLVEGNIQDDGTKYIVHVGHNFGYYNHEREQFEITKTASGRVTRVEHDVGFGKKKYEIIPDFYIV